MTGKIIAHFEILDVLGEGGMGIVYVARDLRLGRRVALKFLPPDIEADEDARERLVQEARAASALNHPNICTIHEIGESDKGAIYIAMALYDGETVKNRLEREPIAASAVVDIARQVARGLEAAHSAGIVHRDIKPANIFVTGDGQVRILDFGLAKVASAHLTKTGSTLGTVHYMSPEQARGDDVDASTDIWALGCVMFEMLSGRNPFDAEHDAAVAYRLMNEEPASLRDVLPPAHAGLEDVVRRCLRKEPAARYRSAADLERALAAFADLQRTPAPTGRSPAWIVAAVLAAVIVGYAGYRTFATDRFPTGGIAVLPFQATGMDSLECMSLSAIVSQELGDLIRPADGPYWVIPQQELLDREIASVSGARDELAARLGVQGFCFRTDDTVVLDMSIIDADLLRQIGEADASVPIRDMRSLQRDAARAIAGMLPRFRGQVDLAPELPGGTDLPLAHTHYVRGRAHLFEGDTPSALDRAIEEFETSVMLDPDYARALTALGMSLLSRYRYHDMDDRWIEQATGHLRDAVEAKPTDVEAHVALADALREAGDLDAARIQFDIALDIDSTNWRVLGLKAAMLRGAGYADEAKRTYRHAVALSPNYWPLRFEFGAFLFATGNVFEARSEFEHVRRLVPGSFLAANAMGGVFYQLGQYDEAAIHFRRASEIRENARSLANLATMLYYDGAYAESAEANRRATDLPDGQGRYDIWGNLGLAEKAAGRPTRAASAFGVAVELAEAALETSPDDMTIVIDLATYYVQLGQVDQAVTLAERALGSLDSPYAWHSAGTIYELAGQRESALFWIEKALGAGYPAEWIVKDLDLATMHDDPRYQALIRGDAPEPLPEVDT